MVAGRGGFFWRRIAIIPAADAVSAGLEDDVHRFRLSIRHQDGIAIDVKAWPDRFPYSTCAAAAPFFIGALIGRPLASVAALDPPSHCTHILDLARLAARYAGNSAPIRYDMRVADRIEGRTRAVLAADGEIRLVWDLLGTEIVGSGAWAGRDLRELSTWKDVLSPEDSERTAMLRRAVMISGSRAYPEHEGGVPPWRSGRLGACFTHHPQQQGRATRHPNWRKDFSVTDRGPLRDFPPETWEAV